MNDSRRIDDCKKLPELVRILAARRGFHAGRHIDHVWLHARNGLPDVGGVQAARQDGLSPGSHRRRDGPVNRPPGPAATERIMSVEQHCDEGRQAVDDRSVERIGACFSLASIWKNNGRISSTYHVYSCVTDRRL